MYPKCACLFHTNEERVAASLGNLLIDKALLYTVSIIKTDRIQDGAATSHIQMEISGQWLPTGIFGKLICYPSL